MQRPPTPPKTGLRARYRELEKFCNTLKVNSENATFVANAMFWKLGLKNRDEIKAIVDAYMEHMKARVEEAKKEGSLQVMDGFIDQTLLDKVKQFTDSSVADDDADSDA